MTLSLAITTLAFQLALPNVISTMEDRIWEGERCKLSRTNETGICVPIPLCEHAANLLQIGINPQTCGFSRTIPSVCCPLSRGRLSRIMCARYHGLTNYHHNIGNHISIPIDPKIPAPPVDIQNFTHLATVGFNADNLNIIWLCGGTLISPFFILSAAHCAESPKYGSAKWIGLDNLDLKNTANSVHYEIQEIYVYPQYKTSSSYHDIALFKVKEKVHFDEIKPACLQTTRRIPLSTLLATGWDKRQWNGEAINYLTKADLRIVGSKKCAQKHAGTLEDIQFCARDTSGRDACQGNSGGPVDFRVGREESIEQHFVVVGITSFGIMCGGKNSIGVFTRVSSYIDWIEGTVWADEKFGSPDYLLSFLLYN